LAEQGSGLYSPVLELGQRSAESLCIGNRRGCGITTTSAGLSVFWFA